MQMSSAMAPTPLPSPQSNSINNNNDTSNPPFSSSMRSPPPPPPLPPPTSLTSSLSLGLVSIPPPPSLTTATPSSYQNHNQHRHLHRSTQQFHPEQHHHHHHYQHVILPEPITTAHPSGEPAVVAPVARVRLSDIMPYDGAPGDTYIKSVEALSGSLMRHNAVVIELGSEESALMRCALESARLFFRTRAQSGCSSGGGGGSWGKPSKGVYMYRAGR